MFSVADADIDEGSDLDIGLDFELEFETVKTYQYYFPHNNVENVVEYLKHIR